MQAERALQATGQGVFGINPHGEKQLAKGSPIREAWRIEPTGSDDLRVMQGKTADNDLVKPAALMAGNTALLAQIIRADCIPIRHASGRDSRAAAGGGWRRPLRGHPPPPRRLACRCRVRLWMDRRFIPIPQESNAIDKRPPDVWKDNLGAV